MVRYFRWTVLIVFCLTSYWILQPRKRARRAPIKKKFDPSKGVGLNLEQSSTKHFNKLAFEASHPDFDKDHYYTEKESQILKYAAEKRYVKVSGFAFCSMLDASSFDTLAPIRDLGGSLASINPDLNEFINLIDGKAYDIFKGMIRKFHLAHQNEAKRLACYTAAEGQSATANLTFSRLFNKINPKNYFKDIIPAIVPSRSTGARRKFKLAYLIMVHELSGFHQLCNLLTTLDDGGAIIMIHVDARVQSNELYYKIKSWTEKRTLTSPDSAIFLTKKRFSNIWGHISLVFTQLSGFWELLDLADWDYVINLSNYDYPLKSNAEIHDCLSKTGQMDKNYIEYWSDTSIGFAYDRGYI
jgi:Core-2/I-Branching enzyme